MHQRLMNERRKLSRTSNQKLTLFEQSNLIFAKAIEDAMNMTTAADLRETTNQAIQKIEALAGLASDEDAAKLRQQGQELHKLAAAREILVNAEMREDTARAAAVTSAGDNANAARPEEKALSREADDLRQAAIETARVARENDLALGAPRQMRLTGKFTKSPRPSVPLRCGPLSRLNVTAHRKTGLRNCRHRWAERRTSRKPRRIGRGNYKAPFRAFFIPAPLI